eukprot:scaffold1027_cov116-Isochrysis_galbana.AAC.7
MGAGPSAPETPPPQLSPAQARAPAARSGHLDRDSTCPERQAPNGTSAAFPASQGERLVQMRFKPRLEVVHADQLEHTVFASWVSRPGDFMCGRYTVHRGARHPISMCI